MNHKSKKQANHSTRAKAANLETSKTANQKQSYIRDEDIARELSELFTCTDEQRRNRINALGMTEFIGAMRLLRQIEDELTEYADQWGNACHWGRGVAFPDSERRESAKGNRKRPELRAA